MSLPYITAIEMNALFLHFMWPLVNIRNDFECCSNFVSFEQHFVSFK